MKITVWRTTRKEGGASGCGSGSGSSVGRGDGRGDREKAAPPVSPMSGS